MRYIKEVQQGGLSAGGVIQGSERKLLSTSRVLMLLSPTPLT